uniref:BCL2 like 11 n=1 Tax=Xenopus tropicalis TaxID=8364 RepID=A0A803KLJ9_XENTR
MAKQPSVLSPDCNSGEGGQLQSTSRQHSHRPLRRGAPTSLSSPFQGNQSDEGGSSSASTPWGPTISPYSPSSFVNRSPHCMLVRGSSLVSKTSSGYFSFEVSPGPVSCDKSTQTPSPPCQAFNHLLSAMADRNPVNQMSPELWIAQELRRIGDDFNASFSPRRKTGSQHAPEEDVLQPNTGPALHLDTPKGVLS